MGVLSSKNQVFQDSNGDYSCSGYTLCIEGDSAAIGKIGHCSCYGTWHYESRELDGCTEVWSGTVAELIALAEGNFDPDMPTRVRSGEDYDSQYLNSLYAYVLDSVKTGGK